MLKIPFTPLPNDRNEVTLMCKYKILGECVGIKREKIQTSILRAARFLPELPQFVCYYALWFVSVCRSQAADR